MITGPRTPQFILEERWSLLTAIDSTVGPQLPAQHVVEKSSALTFDEVYAAQVRFVWRNLRRLGVRASDIEDVAQEVFVIVHRKLSGLDQSTSIRGWIFGVCSRVTLDYRRRAHIRREIATDAVPDPGAEDRGSQGLERQQARNILDQILDQLDDEKRAVFVLFELEQLPMNEVATTVNCPLQTAYSRLHAARREVELAITRRRAREGGGLP